MKFSKRKIWDMVKTRFMIKRGWGRCGIQIGNVFEALSHAAVETVFRVTFHEGLGFPVFDAYVAVLLSFEFQIGKELKKGV